MPSPSDWQKPYIAMMTKADKTKISAKLIELEAAIFNRLQALSSVTNCAERTALEDAIRGLRVLKGEELDFPDWT